MLTDGPLKGGHEGGHDGSLEDGQPDLGEDFSGQDAERASCLPDHLRFP